MQDASSVTLLCYDGSDSSMHAVAAASERLSKGKLVLLHIWDPPARALLDSYSDPGTPVSAGAETGAAEMARATGIAQEGVELARALGWDAEIRLELRRGDEWRVILDIASSVNADLIVLGTRGRTAVQDSVLGTSVSKDVLLHSLRPVLVVPAPAGDQTAAPEPSSVPAQTAH